MKVEQSGAQCKAEVSVFGKGIVFSVENYQSDT